MTILAPKNLWELSDMIKFAVDYDGPIAVRYPERGSVCGIKRVPCAHLPRKIRSDP